MKLNKKDFKYVLEKPDSNFSPARNKFVIEESIRKYDEMRAKKIAMSVEGIRERSEAVASFLEHVNRGKNNDVEKYFGRRVLAKLRGQEIIDEMRNKLHMVNRPSPFYVNEVGLVKNTKGVTVGREVSNAKKKQKR